MIFALIRLLPLGLPILHFLLLKALFSCRAGWFWLALILLALNGSFFCLLYLKKKNRKILLLTVHSSSFAVVGLAFTLILSNPWLINLFLLFWSLLYLVYLESAFHYFYETRQMILFDLKNIVTYLNIIVLFLAGAVLFGFRLFLGLDWWWVWLAILVLTPILLLTRFVFFDLKNYRLQLLVISLIILEFLIALFFLPFSFYVLALLLALAYYLLSSLAALSLAGELKARSVWSYLLFVLAAAALVLSTSLWI